MFFDDSLSQLYYWTPKFREKIRRKCSAAVSIILILILIHVAAVAFFFWVFFIGVGG